MPTMRRALTTALMFAALLGVSLKSRVGAVEPHAAPVDETATGDSVPEATIEPVQYPAPASTSPPSAAASPGAASGAAKPKKAPVQPWKINLFENDFSYKKDPDHEWLPGEEFKDIPLHDFELFEPLPEPSLFSTGGEVRFRQMDEDNRLRPGGPARGDYQLWRWRHYVDFKADWFRAYAEMIDASMDNNPLPVTGIDVNRWDVQNLFLDLRVWQFEKRDVWFRAGRQELLYGSQRLVSPLDWANTRRNFEGLKFFTRSSDWDFDVWFTRPVNTATPSDGPVSLFASHFDSPNMNHTFSGSWLTYKALKDQIFDLYWLWDWNAQFTSPAFTGATNFTGGNRHTLATRWLGHFPTAEGGRTWHGEVEGGYQVGQDFTKNVNAGFIVTGAGHTWNSLPWEPDFWVYYDWASGSNNPNGGTTNTFAQQYGLVHAYLGQIDNIARQNISDINGKLTVKPVKQLTVQTQYHWFDLANVHDTLYTITGQPFGKPDRGRHVGEELDLVATYNFSPNLSVQLGYLWFWYGPVVENNSPRGNAEQLYLQTTFSY